MRKHSYFFNVASPSSRLLHIISLGIGIICLVLIVVSAFNAVNASFFDLPIVEFFDEDGEISEAKEEHEELLEDFDDFKRSEIKKFEKTTGIDFDKFLKYFSRPSLLNLIKVSSYINQYGEATIDAETVKIIKIVVLVIAAYATVLAFFTLLFTYFSSGGFAIFTYVLALPLHLAFCGTGFAVFAAILTLAFAILRGKLNREYKRYKKLLKAQMREY